MPSFKYGDWSLWLERSIGVSDGMEGSIRVSDAQNLWI